MILLSTSRVTSKAGCRKIIRYIDHVFRLLFYTIRDEQVVKPEVHTFMGAPDIKDLADRYRVHPASLRCNHLRRSVPFSTSTSLHVSPDFEKPPIL
jgi:hypothetical protein